MVDADTLEKLMIQPGTSIKGALQRLNETSRKILFVVRENKTLVGTVTDGDIRRGIINGVAFSESVESVMCTHFSAVMVDEGDNEESIRSLMVSKAIEQIPVLDERGALVDAIFWTDLLDCKRLEPKRSLNNQVVIMAGGKGTRLDPFTKILPKPLIPVGDKTILELIMEKFSKYGLDSFILTLNYKKEYIKLFLKENQLPYLIDWVEEEKFLGTAGSISLLEKKITDSFFVANCDSFLNVDYGEILSWHHQHKAGMTIVGCHNEVKIPFGVLHVSNGRLERLQEKPVQDMLINTGIYILEPHIIEYIPKDKYMDMNHLVDLICEKELVTVYPVYDGWFDMGQWAEYQKNIKIFEGMGHV